VSRIEQLGNDVTHRAQVIDAQYGGLLTDTASVLVVTRSLSQRGGGIVEGATPSTYGCGWPVGAGR
jgi:hypothetical protein